MSQNTMGHLRSDVRRSEQVLSAIANRTGMTSAGVEFIKAGFDPFHDTDLNCTGLPDSNGAMSMLQVLTTTIQISPPAGLTTGQNWDCHIIDWPFFGALSSKDSIATYQTTADSSGAAVAGSFNQTGSPNTAAMGSLCAYSFASGGTDMGPFATGLLGFQQCGPSPADLQNPWRVIGKGFEVYNTSSELNKQGSVVVYRQPGPDFTTSTAVQVLNAGALIAGLPNFGYINALIMEGPPQTPSEALRLPNSRQWLGMEGCYVIAPLRRTDVTKHIANYTAPLFYQNTPGDATYYGPLFANNKLPLSGTTIVNAIIPLDYNFMDMDQTGAIFTGLNQNTTLTVNYRQYIEVFPSSSSSLANYSKPSPEWDPVALEVYSRLMYSAPVGVEVKYNGLGDWFMDGVSSISKTLSPIIQSAAKIIPDPRLKALAMVTKTAAPKKAADKTLKRDEKRLSKDATKVSRDLNKNKPKPT